MFCDKLDTPIVVTAAGSLARTAAAIAIAIYRLVHRDVPTQHSTAGPNLITTLSRKKF